MSSIFEIIGGVGIPLWDTLQGTTLSQGYKGTEAQGYTWAHGYRGSKLSQGSHGPDKQTSIRQEMVHMARFGPIFLAGKMCNNNKMATLLIYEVTCQKII